MRTKLHIFLIAVYSLISACKNQWKEPVEVNFYQQITNSSASTVNVDFAQTTIEEISFEGTREQGQKNVVLAKKYENGLPVSFNGSSSYTGITMDIPQGTYTRIGIKIKLISLDGSPSFEISGNYVDPGTNDTLDVLVQYYGEDYIEFTADIPEGSTGINLIAGIKSSATLDFNAVGWFIPVTSEIISEAEISTINGKKTIIISPTSNSNFYLLLSSGLKNSNKVTIQ
ncbi:MAG: hypothetical protein HYY40_08110 [Bacteroidetes bacterium]|nr:hypothetical protein [Bacteroidota bacterium]